MQSVSLTANREIKFKDESWDFRARDVLSFYVDFYKCVKELHRVTKRGAFLCFVVGNRTVKGVQIPTDEIILELFQAQNHYKHHNTFIFYYAKQILKCFSNACIVCSMRLDKAF